ncbi:AhpC/TSA family protein [Chryseobacterium sp. G0201]|nr:AhpC/TSA family protein [Chryseobacterium sp. G0201]
MVIKKIILIVIITLSSVYTSLAYKYTIDVNLKNLSGKVSLYKLGSEKKIHSLQTIDGIFKIEGSVDEAGIYAIIGSKFIASFVIKDGLIKIYGDFNDIKNIKIEDNGENPIHELWSKRKNILDSLTELIDDKLKRSKKVNNISEYRKLDGQKRAYQLIENKFIEDSIVRSNPNKYWALYVLDDNFDNFELAVTKRLFDELSPDLRKNSLGKVIEAKIKSGKKILSVGEKAPDFTSLTRSGSVKKLKDYRGKYVVVNFWASWCIPCRNEIQELKKIYKKTSQNKRVEFISISLDDNRAAWITALKQEKMPWVNLSDLEGFGSKLPISYNVKEIPYNLVIDPKGKIKYIGSDISEIRKKISHN